MALSAPRRCRTCRQLVRGKCETCDAAWIRKPKSWTVANTGDRRWRRIRQVRLALEPLCRFCGAIATTVDHVDGTDYTPLPPSVGALARGARGVTRLA